MALLVTKKQKYSAFNLIRYCILSIFILPANLYGEIYLYIDKNGVYHYTNTPVNNRYKPLTNLQENRKLNTGRVYRPKTFVNSKPETKSTSELTITYANGYSERIRFYTKEVYKPRTNVYYYTNYGNYIYSYMQPSLVNYGNSKGLKLPSEIENYIYYAARQYGIEPALIKAIIHAESYGVNSAVSPKGAMGLMQLMPTTAREMNVMNPFDPFQNILGGTRYLREMLERFGGDVRLALAAYNAGPAHVENYRGIPPFKETQLYVQKVMELWQKYRLN